MHCDISIIIPAYNEERRIEPTLVALDRFMGDWCSSNQPRSYEIVVVDDGSSDGTVALVERLARRLPAVRCIATTPNRGKGHAVRVGMLAACGAVRVMYDADGSIPADQLPGLLEPIRAGRTTIAIGSRHAPGSQTDRVQPFYRRWWSRLANRVVQSSLVPGIRDTQCGFKAFTAHAAHALFRRTRIDGWAFDLEALALARRMGLTVAEVGVRWSDDPRSRINPIRDACNVVRELVIIRRNLRRGVYGDLGEWCLSNPRHRLIVGQSPRAREPVRSFGA